MSSNSVGSVRSGGGSQPANQNPGVFRGGPQTGGEGSKPCGFGGGSQPATQNPGVFRGGPQQANQNPSVAEKPNAYLPANSSLPSSFFSPNDSAGISQEAATEDSGQGANPLADSFSELRGTAENGTGGEAQGKFNRDSVSVPDGLRYNDDHRQWEDVLAKTLEKHNAPQSVFDEHKKGYLNDQLKSQQESDNPTPIQCSFGGKVFPGSTGSSNTSNNAGTNSNTGSINNNSTASGQSGTNNNMQFGKYSASVPDGLRYNDDHKQWLDVLAKTMEKNNAPRSVFEDQAKGYLEEQLKNQREADNPTPIQCSHSVFK